MFKKVIPINTMLKKSERCNPSKFFPFQFVNLLSIMWSLAISIFIPPSHNCSPAVTPLWSSIYFFLIDLTYVYFFWNLSPQLIKFYILFLIFLLLNFWTSYFWCANPLITVLYTFIFMVFLLMTFNIHDIHVIHIARLLLTSIQTISFSKGDRYTGL